MKKNFIFLFFLFSLILNSCKEPADVGLEVQPGKDQIGLDFSDTATIQCFTYREDSLRADGNSLNLAGSFFDPVFGITEAGFYAQFAPSGNNVNFGDSAIIDSIYISLAYQGFYGNTKVGPTAQTFNVYAIDPTENIEKDSGYYSNKTFSASTLIGKTTFIPAPNDSFIYSTTAIAPQLRIRLDTSFGQNTILSQSGQSTLSTPESFLDYFKGVYITPDSFAPIGNRMLYFNYQSTASTMRVFYHNKSDDSLSYPFTMSLICERVNHFKHNYSGTIFHSINVGPIPSDLTTYIQANSGLKTKILFPSLKNYVKDGAIAINKAELVIPVETGSDIPFVPPSALALTAINDNGNSIFTIDDSLESNTYFGGTYDATNKVYKFNIARQVQGILTGAIKDNGLYLIASGSAVSSNRVILKGGSLLNNPKMKLRLTYSSFK